MISRWTLLLCTMFTLVPPALAASEPAESLTLSGDAQALPSLPDGITQLRFDEFFEPIGRGGLEFSEKVKGLDGRRVRILGYMVRRDDPVPGTLILTPRPVQLHDHEYGLADDLPAATLYVTVPNSPGRTVTWTPGLLLLTGTLSIGNHEEPDGRISSVRLTLDPPPAAAVETRQQPDQKEKR